MHFPLIKIRFRSLKPVLLISLGLFFFSILFTNKAYSHPGNYTVDECNILFVKNRTPELSCRIYTSSLFILGILEEIDTSSNKVLEENEKEEWLKKYQNTKTVEINGEIYTPSIISSDIPDYKTFLEQVESIFLTITFAINYNYPEDFFETENQVKLIDKTIFDQAVTTFVVNPDSGFFVDINKYNPEGDNRFNYHIFPKEWRDDTGRIEVPKTNTDQESLQSDLSVIEESNSTSNALITEFRKSLKDGSVIGYIFLIFISIFLGMVHALQPGHGKAFISAIMIMSDKRVFLRSIILGLSTTLSHIFIVILIGISYYLVVYTNAFPFIKVADIQNATKLIEMGSYIGIIVIGITLTYTKFLSLKKYKILPTTSNKTKTLKSKKTNKSKYEKNQSIKSLILSGISGGINPCIEAITVLLIAIGVGQFFLGVALVSFFSLGMAISLIGLANIVTRSKTMLNRFFKSDKYIYQLQLLSSIFIVILGLYLLIINLS